jgi:chloramphenicol-sensitive protein RarD
LNRLNDDGQRGLLYGLISYGLWGVIPLYFRLLTDRVSPLELVACRVGWSFLFLLMVVTVLRAWPATRAAVKQRRTMTALVGSTLMIFGNWFVYIYAVSTDQVLQASLGYFITPLVNVALGVVFLGERLKRFQTIGIVLATIGVGFMTAAGAEVPWIALALAFTFGCYGLLRKLARIDGTSGLLIETSLLFVPALLIYSYLRSKPEALPFDSKTQILLALSGVVTAVPLLFFGAAAHRLALSTLGVLQYLAPSVQFLVAILVFHEPLGIERLASFLCIWIAVAVYTYGSLHGMRRANLPPETEPVPEEVIETA